MYNHQEIEKKWQDYWKQHRVFRTPSFSLRPKYYALDMFPYPSGAGLHVGHPEGMTANDIVARYKHAKGYNVLHPMGWDAFGLPAENYAIKTGTHPRLTTNENITTFKRQIQSLGFSYDWEREIDTTDPDYFQWTQWIFLKLFEHGLAYEQDLPINYCPSCKTGLANEEVLTDFSCERCGNQVEKKKIRQWVLAITNYAERLLKDVDDLDWPEGIKDMQRNWIGKSEGCEFEMKKSDDDNTSIRVYTTRVDTVFGMTYAVIAPDHPDVGKFIADDYKTNCEIYINNANKQSDQDRTADGKEKTGVFTGSYVVNPYNNESVPLWIADYVLGNYGTGAVMAVPAHDERDFEFAKKYDLEIKQSVAVDFVYTGPNAPKKGVETLFRTTIDVILENDKGEILLELEEHSNGSHVHLIGGGVEEGQSELDAVRAEIVEETGYTDIEIMGPVNLSYAQSFGYRANKDKNQKCISRAFHVKLLSENQIPSEIEEGKHTIKWVKKEDVLSNITWEGHKEFWKWFYQGERSVTSYGILVNSGEYNGLSSEEAKRKFAEIAEAQGFGHKKVNYKLRDWLFSRQRYWGEPIPLIHVEQEDIAKLPRKQSEDAWIQGDTLMIGEKKISKIYDGIYNKIICDYDLPLNLPEVEKYEPAGDGNSPLVNVPDFVNVEIAKNLSGKRETNTMPQWGGSCWYYLRFMDPKNPGALVGKEVDEYWGNVDSYVGGAEHAVLHLLYARFWHKFLFDIGVVSTHEPFYRLRNQGMILGMSYKNSKGKLIASDLVDEVPVLGGTGTQYIDRETGDELEKVPAKMSKSLKNVINPDDIVQQYGADTLRMYEMYMADFKDAAPWDTSSIVGVRRFLDKVYALFIEGKQKIVSSDEEALKALHKAIKKIGGDIENYKFNTAIAQMMILINTGMPKDDEVQKEWKESFLQLLHPFAPHMAEECWENLERESSQRYKTIHFATGNKGKIDRAQMCISTLDAQVSILEYSDIVEVEETGKTPIECALEKLEVYKGKDIDAPIMTADTAVYFEGQDFEPTHVRRVVLKSIGKQEGDLTREELALEMVNYYRDIAKKAGGEIGFYYQDAFAVLFPNGEIRTHAYNRYYTLTDTHEGEVYTYAPMRGLYYSQVTGKRANETTDEDHIKEFECQVDAMRELFSYQQDSIFFVSWPEYKEELTIDSEITIGVQVLGKLRGEIQISKDEDQASVLEKAKSNENIAKWLEGKHIIKEIYVPGKIVNIVVK